MFRVVGNDYIDKYHRRSLGRAVSASSHVPLRILAANILRETSLADIDVRLFWPHDLLHGNDPRLPSSFIADSQWLHDTVLYLRDFDDHRAFSVERYLIRVYCSIAKD